VNAGREKKKKSTPGGENSAGIQKDQSGYSLGILWLTEEETKRVSLLTGTQMVGGGTERRGGGGGKTNAEGGNTAPAGNLSREGGTSVKKEQGTDMDTRMTTLRN